MMRENTTARWFKENIEAIAIAVVMALVIRQFAIEAFKIPTESMAPTLLGDHLGGTGDRILVDKIPYMFTEPSRWSVIVFKYPLNEAKNYIKRLVGLGGETLSIRDGDVYIDGKIARKPESVQEALFFPVFPGHLSEDERSRAWQTDDGDPWTRIKEDEFRVSSPTEPALMAYREPIRDSHPWASQPGGYDVVGDVRLRVNVTPEGAPGDRILLRIVENRIENDLVLAVGEGKSVCRHGATEHPLPGVVLDPGDDVDVSFANVDDELIVCVDGDEFRFEYPSLPKDEEPDHSRDTVRFGVERGKADFREIRLDRDVWYTSSGNHTNVKIPENHYFVLGDNSRNSADSREWKKWVITMKDGTTYSRDLVEKDEDVSQRPEAGPGEEVFQDVHGIWRVIDRRDVEERHTEVASFVPRENLIGRAFFVFWPLNPFTGQFRLKFIR